MEKNATFTARIVREGKWFIAWSPEFPEGNGQALTEEETCRGVFANQLPLPAVSGEIDVQHTVQ